MDLGKLSVVESVEEIVETRKVTVTFSFDFVNGEITDADLKAFYDLIKPSIIEEVAEVEEKEETDLSGIVLR